MDICAIKLSYPVTLSLLFLPLTCQFNKELHGQMWWGWAQTVQARQLKDITILK